MRPYWLKVLDHFLKKNYIKNGLSLPFLIGARTILDPAKNLLTVSEILNQMNDSNLISHISLMKCPNINEYVFGILDLESLKINRKKSIYKSFENLSITDCSFEDIYRLEGINKVFEIKYNDAISNGNYSKEYGKWIPYSKEDRNRILEVLDLL